MVSVATRERIERLRQKMLIPPQVCTEKGKYMTQSYRRTQGFPVPMRRAMALEHILGHLTVTIDEDELLVGRTTGKQRGGPLSPEINASWYETEIEQFSTRLHDPYAPLAPEEKQDIHDMVAYWKGRSLFDQWETRIPEEYRPYNTTLFSGGAYCANTQYYGHIATDYTRLLEKGVEGLQEEIHQELKKIPAEGEAAVYLNAMSRSLHAVVILAERYARLAQELAEQEERPVRKAELEKIARVCRRVPRYPARTFHEAVQSMWLGFIALSNEAWGAGPSLSRIDQYLYPYYKRDLEDGTATEEEMTTLLAMLLIRMNGQFTVYSAKSAEVFGGVASKLSITLGGLTPQGESAVNPLSYLILEAEELAALAEDIVILVGENTPEPFLLRSVELAARLRGKIKFVGQDVIVKQFLEAGRPLELARRAVVTGCHAPSMMGASLDIPGGTVNLPLLLDLALHDGYSPMLKTQLGPHTGDPRTFTSFEQVMTAFQRQFAAAAPIIQHYKNTDKELYARYMPNPLQSALLDGCIQRAKDVIQGGLAPYMSFGVSLSGAPNVGDSLAAIRKWVFEERRLSMGQLLDALEDDFQGHDQVLHLLTRAPKFGNDQPEVDSLVNEILSYCSDVIAKTKGIAGASSTCAAATITGNIPMGRVVGAQPDGRRAGMPLSEGGISPHQGRNVSGITATLKSVAGLDYKKLQNGSVLNIRIDPDAVKTQEKREKLATLIRSFHAMGGYLVQFNIVSTETLKEAQKHPEQYKDLLVRVSTYSAYFVELSEQLQNDIIARLSFGSV